MRGELSRSCPRCSEPNVALGFVFQGVAERRCAAYAAEPLFVVAIEGSSPGPKPDCARLFTQYRADDHCG